ncbi:MAG TPA: hypothetical protein VMZ29_10890 [Candidatus Bathyarchaeia archaeon]|nr:hypothetical protein [Candidatus Bathyarchaeia archaeon]
MAVNVTLNETKRTAPRKFITLDFARGLAIFMMLILHVLQNVLDIDQLMNNINDQPIIALVVMFFAPFFGGLAGFFLLISSASNMISMYRDLEHGSKIRSLVFKQVFGGVLLLVFAMICEGITGYGALAGSFFRNLNNIGNTNWSIPLWRWNTFETIHTIAWCLIFNGLVQGLLSLKGNWKNRRNLIIAYIVLAVSIIALTQPVWWLVGKIVPGFPFGTFPSGHSIDLPYIGTETFWQIFRTPFLGIFAGYIEPLFPYLAISFVGSIIGIVLSRPKDEIKQKFPRQLFLAGLGMFIAGVIGLIAMFATVIVQGGANGIDNAFTLYLEFGSHRFLSADNPSYSFPIPPFSWLAQFMGVNGFSIILIAVLLRVIEFRGISHKFADRTKIIRRFGTIAFTNYNNQWIFFIMWEITSLVAFGTHYQKPLWLGMGVIAILTVAFYSLILWLWEKIGYILSLEWFIRTMTNNIVPIRRQRFPEDTKWWQRGQINAQTSFYNVDWVNLSPTPSGAIDASSTDTVLAGKLDEKASIVSQMDKTKDLTQRDSRLALTISIVGLCSVLFILVSIFGLILSISARKNEGKNKTNQAALIISSITIVLLLVGVVILSILKIGILGIF